jgi:nitrate reductase gamma subunit
MALEILTFRSLFRNTRLELRDGPKLDYASNKWLWLAALAFHYTFLVIFLRHFRFFLEPVPGLVDLLQRLDGFFEVGVPGLYLTDAIILLALLYLLLRRFAVPQIRYISLAADYFPLFLILGLVLSGILMRYFIKVDIRSVKQLAMGLVSLHPTVPEGIGSIFYVHLFLLSVLIAYFPLSKLMHAPGVFLSPTRNLPNDSRMVRHINPWNYPVKVHSYLDYENDFREKMIEAGLPVEKE